MKCREEQLDVLEKRYNVCHKERDELNEKLIESEKFQTSHKEEMNRVVDAMKRETVGMRGKMDCRWLHWVIV